MRIESPRRRASCPAWLLFLALWGHGSPAAEPAGLLAGFPRAVAVLETAGPQCLMLEVFLALDPEQRAQGLMHIEELEAHEGMYFRYPEPAGIVMWMKNTLIPLDMLFIRGDGTIAGVAERTEPLSTRRISSPGPVPAVLEVNAGIAQRWGLRPGTRLLLLEAR